jgi:hypothetical protein
MTEQNEIADAEVSAVTIHRPQVPADLANRGQAALRLAETLKLDTPDDVQSAVDFAADIIRPSRERILGFFAAPVKAAHDLHKWLVAQRNAATAPWDEADAIIRRKVSAALAAERARVDAERRRLEIEALDQQKRMAEAEAAQLRAAGEAEAADQVLAAPPAPVFVAPPPSAKVEGATARTVWKADRNRPVDPLKLAAFVVANPSYAGLLAVNWTAADAMAKSQRERFPAFEDCGVAVYADQRASIRRQPGAEA